MDRESPGHRIARTLILASRNGSQGADAIQLNTNKNGAKLLQGQKQTTDNEAAARQGEGKVTTKEGSEPCS